MWISIGVPAETEEELQSGLDFLTAISAGQCRRHRLPHPYNSGVRYVREPEGRERWQTALETLKRGEGDCEDLAAYLAGWMRANGTPGARAVLLHSSVGYHCVVQADGQTIDPSRRLGMSASAEV